MHQFLLDKEIEIHKSNAIAIDVTGKHDSKYNFFFQPTNKNQWNTSNTYKNFGEDKPTNLLTHMIVTYHEVARLISFIDDDGDFGVVI